MSAAANWTRENIAWLAGLFEGEGCIYIKDDANHVRMHFHATDEDVLRKFRDIAGVGHVGGPYQRYHKDGRPYKPVWRWEVSHAKQWYPLLMTMWPWLGERRRAKAADAVKVMSRTRRQQRSKDELAAARVAT
jgi:hypothetical protein